LRRLLSQWTLLPQAETDQGQTISLCHFECDCQPPVKVRVAHDLFGAQWTMCGEAFHRAEREVYATRSVALPCQLYPTTMYKKLTTPDRTSRRWLRPSAED
jgi:hypothetical protein